MLEFVWPLVFILLPLPYLYRYYASPIKQALDNALVVPFFNQLKTIGNQHPTQTKPFYYQLLWFLLWGALLTALARPQWVGEPIAIPLSGRDLIMAIDVSGSMKTPDLTESLEETNRLSVVKEVAEKFISSRNGDRIGLILFGSNAYLQNPLTFDLKTVNQFLSEALIGIAGEKTAIGDAIGLAVKQFDQDNNPEFSTKRVLILLTDGTTNAGVLSPEQAVEIAKKSNLVIYTIGIGASSIKINSILGSHLINPSADLDEKLLRTIASVTGGKYFRARDKAGLSAIYQEIDRLQPILSDPQTFRPIDTLFQWPLGFSASLFALIILIELISTLIMQNKRIRHG